jgi:hypothetical protein
MQGVSPVAVSLGALWLPVILSAVFAFIGSAVIWMVFKYHNGDWKLAPDDAALQDALRATGVTTGQYMFPQMDPAAPDKAASKKSWEERYAKGPVGVVYAGAPGKMNMAKTMSQTVLFFLVVSFFVAYIAAHALAQGAPYLKVFQIVGATAFVAYAAGPFMDSIWFYRSWRATWLNVLDALIYGCLTAGTFGWLWPR